MKRPSDSHTTMPRECGDLRPHVQFGPAGLPRPNSGGTWKVAPGQGRRFRRAQQRGVIKAARKRGGP
jgi:hypothetical protein